MSEVFKELAGLDKTVHEPARLAICASLAACERADFLYLLRLTGLSKGNLSAHLTKLEAAGVVVIEKGFEGRIPRTQVALTPEGRQTVTNYWTRIEALREASRRWRPDGEHDRQAT